MKVRSSEFQILYRLICDKLIEEKYSEKLRKTAPRGEALWSGLSSKEYESRFGGYNARTDQTYLYRKSLELDGLKNSDGTVDNLTLFKIFKELDFTSIRRFRDQKFSASKTKIFLTEFENKHRSEIDTLEFEFQLARKNQERKTDQDRAVKVILKYFDCILNRQWLSAFKLRDSYHPVAKGDFKRFKRWMREVHIHPKGISVVNQEKFFDGSNTKEIVCHVHVHYLIYPYVPDLVEKLSDTNINDVNEIEQLIERIRSELMAMGISDTDKITLQELLDPIDLHKFVFLHGAQRRPFVYRWSELIKRIFDQPEGLEHDTVYKISCLFTRKETRLQIKPEPGRFVF